MVDELHASGGWAFISSTKNCSPNQEFEFLTLEYGTDRLSENVGTELQLYDE
jgi:hypothetical protein